MNGKTMKTDDILECFYDRLNKFKGGRRATVDELTPKELHAIYALANVVIFSETPSKNLINKRLNLMAGNGTLLKRKGLFRLSNNQKVIARLEGKI